MTTMLSSALPGLALDDAQVMAGAGLRAVYQPIVCLTGRRAAGYEALARGPAGSELATPDRLFARAAELGRVGQLDASCRRAALQGAVDAGLRGPAVLFLNAEPEGLGADPSGGVGDLLAVLAGRGVRIVLEITERALTRDPAELIAAVARVRSLGWGIALDDVGAERASLALMPFLEPDVIKLDLRLIQQRTTVDVAEIVNAVLAQSERTGALILAEGIETEEHLTLARSMGATLGQGWLLGRPGDMPPDAALVGLDLPPRRLPGTDATPWELLRGSGAVREATKPLLVALSITLERQAAAGGEAAVVLGTFQQERYVTVGTRRRYAELVRTAAFVAVFGTSVSPEPVPGVRGVAIPDGCPLAEEWDVVVLGPHFAAALVAHDRGLPGPEDGRVFDYTVTYDRERVLRAARALMARITEVP